MITRVDAGTTRDFTHDELDAMTHTDTSAALNAARRRAGQRGGDVAVRGDDGSLHEALEHHQKHVGIGETVAATMHALDLSAAVGVHIPGVAAALESPAGIVAGGALVFAATQYAMKEMQDAKDGLRDAATRDTLHAGMLLSLELPSGFVGSEIAKLGVGTRNTDPAVKVRDQVVGSPLATALQLHCDQGVGAAEDFLRSGVGSPQAFFALCPKVSERYAADAAFRAGFDALVWAQASAPADAEQLKADVHARDARYAAASIQYRI
jgi:hypothetical protein